MIFFWRICCMKTKKNILMFITSLKPLQNPSKLFLKKIIIKKNWRQ